MSENDFNVWMVRAGEKGIYIEDFIGKKIIAIGWSELGELPKQIDYERLKELLKNHYPEQKDGWYNQCTSQIWKFVYEFEIGDRIVTYDPGLRIYYIGEITSNYYFDKTEDFPHTIDVKWKDQVIERDSLKVQTKNSLGSTLTIFNISNEIWNELEGLASKKPLMTPFGEVVNPSDEGIEETLMLAYKELKGEKSELDRIKEDIISSSTEFINDILSDLSWQEAELLVAGVIETLGYKTRMTSRGSDLGSDIFASPDGLGMVDPRIKIEVKKRKDKTGADTIRNFIGGMRHVERGIFVSFSGFTKEAQYESERANFPLTLIDANMLIGLITENYESLKPEIKALVPLKKIYWPL